MSFQITSKISFCAKGLAVNQYMLPREEMQEIPNLRSKLMAILGYWKAFMNLIHF